MWLSCVDVAAVRVVPSMWLVRGDAGGHFEEASSTIVASSKYTFSILVFM